MDATPTGIALRLDLIKTLAPHVGEAVVDLAARAEAYILGPVAVELPPGAIRLAAAAPGAERDVPPGQSWAFPTHRTQAEVGICDTCASVTRCLNAGPDGGCHRHHPAAPAEEAKADAPPPGDTAPRPAPVPKDQPEPSADSLAVIRRLAAAGERITGASLGRALGVSGFTGSHRLRRLEQAGHVRRAGTGAGTRYELVEEVAPIAATPTPEPAPAPPLTINLPPPARSTPAPRPATEPLPAGKASLPEDRLRLDPSVDADTVPATDIDTVVDWLRAQGIAVVLQLDGLWSLNKVRDHAARDLLIHANKLRKAVGLPPFRVRRI
jgi:hypothetical protein